MNKKEQGKKNRAAGQRFELLVRKDLESKGWIVDKWSNNVEFEKIYGQDVIKMNEKERGKIMWDIKGEKEICNQGYIGKLIPAKHKFRGKGIPMAMGTGFPDFVCFKPMGKGKYITGFYEVIGCEVKSNGYLDKIEKEKCSWLLKNNIFSKILIASKSKEKRGIIIYKEFEK